MKSSVSLSGTTQNAFLCDVVRPRHSDAFLGTLVVTISSGTGTVALQVSPDGGTTKVPVKDSSGLSISTTSSAQFNFIMGNGDKISNPPKLYADLSGGSSAVVTVTLFDNR